MQLTLTHVFPTAHSTIKNIRKRPEQKSFGSAKGAYGPTNASHTRSS